MRILLLLACSLALAAADPAWTTVIDSRFDGTVKLVPIPGDNKNATGSLPDGVKEDSAWAELTIAYTAATDAAGTPILRASMSAWKKGEAQLKYRLPKLDPGAWRLVVAAASPSSNKLSLSIADNGPPYKSHLQKTIVLGATMAEQTVEFDLPALDGPKALLVRLGKAGTVDLRAIRLERRN